MSGIKFDDDTLTPRRLQELARHQLITKLLADVLMDMQVCRLEGWDETEFIRQLHKELDGLMEKIGRKRHKS